MEEEQKIGVPKSGQTHSANENFSSSYQKVLGTQKLRDTKASSNLSVDSVHVPNDMCKSKKHPFYINKSGKKNTLVINFEETLCKIVFEREKIYDYEYHF